MNSFSVVISTYNRSRLLERALESVYAQTVSVDETIVVDDASTDDTSKKVGVYKSAIYIRQDTNQGAGAARNKGLFKAKSQWIIVLDDDDELLPDAIENIQKCLIEFPNAASFPVLQFARSNGYVSSNFALINLVDYLTGNLRGDFIPVINSSIFLKKSLIYPETRTIGEHLLWWKIAKEFGIPTWSILIAITHEDAPLRLTSARNQLAFSRDYAILQEITLEVFSKEIRSISPNLEREKRLGAGLYRLLSGDRTKARQHAIIWWDKQPNIESCALLIISILPLSFARFIFLMYRKRAKTL